MTSYQMRKNGVLHRIKGFLGPVMSCFFAKGERARPYQLRSDMVKRLSHDMRTTLTSIVGYSEFIESKTVEPVLGFTSKIIRESGSDLVRLFQSFYDLVQIEAGDAVLNLSDVDMMTAIRDVVRAHQMRASEWNVRLTLTRSPDMDFLKMQTDFVKFQQMLEIMTFATLQFAAPKSTLQLHVDYDERPGYVNLSFLEFGAGEDHPDVGFMEDFWSQSECPPMLLQKGPGIELALAKALLKFLKGTAAYRYLPNVGVNFRVTLPLKLG